MFTHLGSHVALVFSKSVRKCVEKPISMLWSLLALFVSVEYFNVDYLVARRFVITKLSLSDRHKYSNCSRSAVSFDGCVVLYW